MQKGVLSQKIEQILGLDSPPIAVKIVKMEEQTPNIKAPTQKSRHCQLLMLAEKDKP